MISNFYQDDVENCALLGYYAASSGNSLPTFRDNLPVHFSRVKNPGPLPTIREELSVPSSSNPSKMGPTVCHESSVSNYHYSLRNKPEQHIIQNALFVTFVFAQ